MISKLLKKILKEPEGLWVCVGLLVVLGIVILRGLKSDLFPPLNFPILNVITEIPSFSSLQVERQVTLPIESAAGGVLGVRRVRSDSVTGISMVSVEFAWGTDMILARQLLMESLSQIHQQLPPEAEPSIETLSATLAMIEGYSLRSLAPGGGDLVALRDTALYDLKPRLQRLKGVYKVIIMGGRVLEYSVRPNPYSMIKYNVTLDDLKKALAVNNILETPGVVNHYAQELVLHADSQVSGPEEISSIVVAVKGGVPVRVKDIARVHSSFQYVRGNVSEDGIPSVMINVYKQPMADSVAVAQRIRGEISRFRARLPKQIAIRNYYDQAGLVHDSIASVKESIWIGALFVIMVLALFLHDFKSTLIATCSIPLSLIAALVLMRLFSIGLNVMSLGGLAIGIAVIVDDAVVVLENIFRWINDPSLKKNLSVIEIAIHATEEVASPVIISTLANIAIFAPMVLVAGFAGRLFSPVAASVTFSLLASLLVSLTVIPALCVKWLSPQVVDSNEGDSLLHRFYNWALDLFLKRPKAVLLLAFLAVVFGVGALKRLNVEFLPALDEGSLLMTAAMPPGTSLAECTRLTGKIERWVEKMPGVVTVVRRVGHDPGSEDVDSVNHADIMIKLLPKNKRPIALEKFIAELDSQTAQLPSIQINYLMPLADKINDALGGVPADLGVNLYGPSLKTLHLYANKIVPLMGKIRGVIDLRPPADIPIPSLEAAINRKEAGRLGISERTILETLKSYSVGLTATWIRLAYKEIGIVIHFAKPGAEVNFEALKSLPLQTAGGNIVPLEQVASLSYGSIPSDIAHEHLSRKIVITANIKGRNSRDVAADVEKALEGLNLPQGYSWGFSGKYQSEQKAIGNMLFVLTLSLTLVAVILWFEFKSLTQVFLILLTFPLAAIGAALSLKLFHETLNVSSMIGAVLLVGIVVKNGILLLDYMNRALSDGKNARAAIKEAALKRVRPILMTACVTLLGLVPLATGWGTGSELLRPLAIAVIGGLVSSTALTLAVLPAAALLLIKK